MSTHPPAGGGGAGSRRGRGRGRVPQCGPPGWTRLSHGDAWSGKCMPRVRACASTRRGHPTVTPATTSGTIRGSWGQLGGGSSWSGASLVIALFCLVALACAASPALAFAPLWTQTVDTRSSLATGTRGPIVAWKVTGVGTDSIEAAQYPREGGAALSQRTIVPARRRPGGLVRGRRRRVPHHRRLEGRRCRLRQARRPEHRRHRVRSRHDLLGRPGRRAAWRRRGSGPQPASPPTAPAAPTSGAP